MMTLFPNSENFLAKPSPIPLVPPVIKIVCPLNVMISPFYEVIFFNFYNQQNEL